MKIGFIYFWILIGTFAIGHSQTAEKVDSQKVKEPYWTLEKAKKQAQDYNDSTKWEIETLDMEVENLQKYPLLDFPLYQSPFPTPKYSSPGNGNGGIESKIADKNIVGQYAIIGKGEHSEHLFQNFKDTTEKYATYFAILTISDGKDSMITGRGIIKKPSELFLSG